MCSERFGFCRRGNMSGVILSNRCHFAAITETVVASKGLGKRHVVGLGLVVLPGNFDVTTEGRQLQGVC